MLWKNLALGYVDTAPSPAASGTSLVLGAGEGARFPAPATDGPFYATLCPVDDDPHLGNSEIVLVTARSTDTLTIVRTQRSTSARTVIVGDRVLLGIFVEDITNVMGMSRQAIINGNFDVWQRGVSLTPLADATSYFLPDRWYQYATDDGGTLPTLTWTRQILTSGDIPNAFYYSRLATNGAGTSLGANSEHQFVQKIEHGTRMLCGDGKKVTVSFWARSDIANKKIGIQLWQQYGSTGTPSSAEIINGANWTLTSTWTKYTFTFTTNTLVGKTFGTDNNDSLTAVFYLMWGTNKAVRVGAGTTAETYVGSGNIDIAQVQLCAGDVALPFQPKSFEEELRACMRYFQKSFPYGTAPAQNTGSTTGETRCVTIEAGAKSVRMMHPLSPRMRTTPTMTTYNPSAANAEIRDISNSVDCSAVNTTVCKENWLYIYGTGNAATTVNAVCGIHWTADAEL